MLGGGSEEAIAGGRDSIGTYWRRRWEKSTTFPFITQSNKNTFRKRIRFVKSIMRFYFAENWLCEERILIQEGHQASFGPIASRWANARSRWITWLSEKGYPCMKKLRQAPWKKDCFIRCLHLRWLLWINSKVYLFRYRYSLPYWTGPVLVCTDTE